MTTLTLRPLRPALSLPPALCTQPQDRPTPTKLSLLIPLSAEACSTVATQSSSRSTYTPVAPKRPKLSLNFGDDTKRTFVTSGSFSSSRPCTSSSPSDDEGNASEEDITSRNTVANTHMKSAQFTEQTTWTRTYIYTQASGTKSILKGSPNCMRTDNAILSRNVSFHNEHTVIQSSATYCEYHDEEDIENMSPPSTTSSTDSEESESDSEPKTPIDDDDSRGPSFDRFAPASRGKWRKPKREWVWTLGGSDNTDIMQELEYSSASLMQVEAS